MKIAMVIVRTLMGLLFIFAAIVVLFKLAPVPELTGVAKTFNDGIFAVGYFVPMLKIVELTCGILFVTGRFVPLATILIAPIIVNIFAYHAFIDRSGLPVAIFLVAANIFVAFYYRIVYRELFRSNPNLTR
ncbi:MAG: DoxX family protein [Acidobacteria bacterium]|nr:DoxX family protein [Acidobacteriota bacterium]